MAAVLVDRESALRIERQTIGPRLAVLRDVCAVVAALVAKY